MITSIVNLSFSVAELYLGDRLLIIDLFLENMVFLFIKITDFYELNPVEDDRFFAEQDKDNTLYGNWK